MTDDIAFLHTAQVHVAPFQSLVENLDPQLRVRHDVDEGLLADALEHGMTSEISARVVKSMVGAADTGARIVVCTCSTIGGVAEHALSEHEAMSMRIDRALADKAVSQYQRILVVAAVQSTLLPTQELFRESAALLQATPVIEFKLVDYAWQHFLSGRLDKYYETIAEFIRIEKTGYDCIVLAQASMVPAADILADIGVPVLVSPELGVRSAVNALRQIA